MGNKQSTEMFSIYDELERKLQDSDATPMVIPLEYLKTITRDFSSAILGNGGFGVVYKGYLRSEEIIAVKRLYTPHLIAETFRKEVRFLMGMRKHPNVVRFVGYCDESIPDVVTIDGKPIAANRLEKLLCFEYVPNESLDKHISAEPLALEWDTRFKIIKGICNGLHFLHEECRIVHLDLKPQNILMDVTMSPKIADFGLSRIFGLEQTRFITKNCPGTLGYMAKEYIDKGVITKKADIFSLGVIFIEIITGSKEYPDFLQGSPSDIAASLQEFKDKVLGSWRSRILSSLLPISVEYYMLQVEQCITIALKCVDFSMEKRPTIEDIIKMLNGVDQQAVLPSRTQIISMEKIRDEIIFSLDANQTERWIITGHPSGYIHMWNCDPLKFICTIQARDGVTVTVVKVIERKQWFIAGTVTGFINVYTYKPEVQEITSFHAGVGNGAGINGLAVHPTKPYVLSSCGGYIQLWDWDQNWTCIQTYEKESQPTFNPKDTNSFASASYDNTVKLWSLDSPTTKYTLSGHSRPVNCLDFFIRDDQQYLITVSYDETAKIWNMQTEECIYTLEGFMSSVMSVVSHPTIPLLITGTEKGVIHLWSARDFSLKRIINNSDYGSVHALACLMGSKRIVIGTYSAISIMEIHEEEADAS